MKFGNRECTVYIKGNEKIKWLIDLLKGEIEVSVVNLNELNFS